MNLKYFREQQFSLDSFLKEFDGLEDNVYTDDKYKDIEYEYRLCDLFLEKKVDLITVINPDQSHTYYIRNYHQVLPQAIIEYTQKTRRNFDKQKPETVKIEDGTEQPDIKQ